MPVWLSIVFKNYTINFNRFLKKLLPINIAVFVQLWIISIKKRSRQNPPEIIILEFLVLGYCLRFLLWLLIQRIVIFWWGSPNFYFLLWSLLFVSVITGLVNLLLRHQLLYMMILICFWFLQTEMPFYKQCCSFSFPIIASNLILLIFF